MHTQQYTEVYTVPASIVHVPVDHAMSTGNKVHEGVHNRRIYCRRDVEYMEKSLRFEL